MAQPGWDVLDKVIFQRVTKRQEALQAFVEAKEAARANPTDTPWKRFLEEAKEEHDLQDALLESLFIEHDCLMMATMASRVRR
jgi:hypothetical protein